MGRRFLGFDGAAVTGIELDELSNVDIDFVKQNLTGSWLPQQQSRLREFSAGRMCAGRCLLSLGYPEPLMVLDRGRDLRSPLWPSGVTGSISHSRRFAIACAAKKCTADTDITKTDTVGSGPAVASRSANVCAEPAAIGIDIVDPLRISERLFKRVTSAKERSELQTDFGHSTTHRDKDDPSSLQSVDSRLLLYSPELLYALTFSAKESFYKAHYQLVPRYLGFSALRVHAVSSHTFSSTDSRGLTTFGSYTRSERNELGAPLEADSWDSVLASGVLHVGVGDDNSLRELIERCSIRWILLRGGEVVTAAAIL